MPPAGQEERVVVEGVPVLQLQQAGAESASHQLLIQQVKHIYGPEEGAGEEGEEAGPRQGEGEEEEDPHRGGEGGEGEEKDRLIIKLIKITYFCIHNIV